MRLLLSVSYHSQIIFRSEKIPRFIVIMHDCDKSSITVKKTRKVKKKKKNQQKTMGQALSVITGMEKT